MCVIVYKKKGLEVPGLNILEKCWDVNAHGAGIAWRDGQEVAVVKGIMQWEQFRQVIQEIKSRLKNYDAVFHFRLTSRGRTSPEMTHPFVIGEQPERLVFRTKGTVLFHNGTLRGFGNGEKSDTCECAEWLGRLKKKGLSTTDVVEILNKLDSTDRFVVMSPKKVYLIGKWEDKDGYKFSNMSWDLKQQECEREWYSEYFRGNDYRRWWCGGREY